MDDEYELLPREELLKLRKEVELLKNNPLHNTAAGKTLQDSVDGLTSSINRLIKTFSDVESEMAKDYKDGKTVDEHLQTLTSQNEKIAAGIVAIADMLKEQEHTPQVASSTPTQHHPPESPPEHFPEPKPIEPFPNKNDVPSFPQSDPFPHKFDSLDKLNPPPHPPKKKRGLFR